MNQEQHSNGSLPPSSNTPPVDEWFRQVGAPSGTIPPPKSKVPKRLIIAGILLLLVIATVLLTVFVPRSQPSPSVSTSCFKASSYEDLVTLVKNFNDDSVTIDDVKPQKLLYTHYIYFTTGTANFDLDASDNTVSFLNALGNYYQTKQSAGPIVVHVNANYVASESIDLIKQRIANIKNALQVSGFALPYIVADEPTLVTPTEDIDFGETDIASVSVAPSVSCNAQ